MAKICPECGRRAFRLHGDGGGHCSCGYSASQCPNCGEYTLETGEACSNCRYKKLGDSLVECLDCGELQSESESKDENLDLFVCRSCGGTW